MAYVRTYSAHMRFEWDPRKAEANRKKHRIGFADAVTVLEDDFAVTISDDEHGEERFVTIGLDGHGRTLVVVYSVVEGGYRIISARNATQAERKQYEG